MLQKIKSRFDDLVLYECEADTILEALQKGIAAKADLRSANLHSADLRSAKYDGKLILNIIQVSGIGSENRSTVAIILADEIQIQCGCFAGTLTEFTAKIKETHTNNPRYLAEYLAAVSWIEACATASRESVK